MGIKKAFQIFERLLNVYIFIERNDQVPSAYHGDRPHNVL